MALKETDREIFRALLLAAQDGHLALVECKCAKTGEYRAVIVAVSRDGEDYIITPLGHAFADELEDVT